MCTRTLPFSFLDSHVLSVLSVLFARPHPLVIIRRINRHLTIDPEEIGRFDLFKQNSTSFLFYLHRKNCIEEIFALQKICEFRKIERWTLFTFSWFVGFHIGCTAWESSTESHGQFQLYNHWMLHSAGRKLGNYIRWVVIGKLKMWNFWWKPGKTAGFDKYCVLWNVMQLTKWDLSDLGFWLARDD